MQFTRDAVTGFVLIAVGAAMFAGAWGFDPPAGTAFGAGFFPKIVSSGMALSGLLILLGRERRSLTEVMRIDARGVARVALLVAMIVLYALALDPVGFHISTVALLFAATLFFGGSLPSALLLSVLATAVFHFIFYSIMKVALPWGLLLPVAW